MKEEKVLFVTSDLLSPLNHPFQQPDEHEGIKEICSSLKELEIKAHLLWKRVENTNFDHWLEQEHTPQITEIYLNLFPSFLKSACCVIGWELPNGLCRTLEEEGILWVSFSPYLWGPRTDMVCVESSDSSLLPAIHRPIPRTQPTWNLDEDIRFSTLLVMEPPRFHRTRIHNGKVYTLNDCIEPASELIADGKQLFVFPGLTLTDVESPALSLLGPHNLQGSFTLASVYIASERTFAVASLDPSVEHLARPFQKPFHSWNTFYPSSALITCRDLKNRSFWQEILKRARIKC